MEITHEPSPQEAEANQRHLDWRCDHFHWGPGEAKTVRRAAQVPHRHVAFEQAVFDIDADLLASTPVRWTVEWAGPDLRCRGIEVASRDAMERWVATPGTTTGAGEPPAARLRRWL
jgi:hypothetical protein